MRRLCVRIDNLSQNSRISITLKNLQESMQYNLRNLPHRHK